MGLTNGSHRKEMVMAVIRHAIVVALLALTLAACRGKMESAEPEAATTTTAAAETATAVNTTAETTLSPCNIVTTTGGPSEIPPVAISGNIPLYVPLPSTVNSQVQIR